MSSQPLPQRFAALVIAGFREAGHSSDADVVAAGGPSTTFMTKLRKVAKGEEDMPQPRGDTMRRIEVAAQWPPGVARRVWDGGDVGTVRATGLHPAAVDKRVWPADPVTRQWIWALMDEYNHLTDRIVALEREVRGEERKIPPLSFPTTVPEAARNDTD